MKKKEIFEKLDILDQKEYLIVGDTALVCHGILSETDKIEIALRNPNCSLPDCFIVSSRDFDGFVDIKGYPVQTLESLKENEERKTVLKKIELKIDLEDTYKNERELRKQGFTLIGGVDEVGRGPLVGPVVAACVILPETFQLEGLTDSKKLSETKREFFFEEIQKQAISYGIGIVSEKRIDEINIYEATKEAMIMAINQCSPKPEYVLTDAMKLEIDVPVKPIIKGDLRSITISAASVIAKVTRDRMLVELDKKYPMYDFKNNVGYPTKKHLEAIEKYGIIPEHRKSYGPVAEYLEKSVNK